MKILFLLSLCLALSGCGPVSPPIETEAPTAPAMASEPVSVPAAYDDQLLKELTKSGSVKNEDGSVLYSFDYRIPQLPEDSEAARQLNLELAAPLSQDPAAYETITWQSHWNDKLLSLILMYRYPFSTDFS